MDDHVALLDEILEDAALLHGLKIPPQKTAKCTIRNERENCQGCEFEPFCVSCCTVKINLLGAQIEDRDSYSLVDDINKIFTAAAAGIKVEPDELKEVF